MDKTKRVLSDVVRFTTSNYLSNIFNLITGLVMRRVLGPAVMGIFSELMLVFQYGKYHQLGILDSLDREIPYFNGRGDFQKVKQMQDIGFSVCLFTSVILGIILVIFSLFLKKSLNPYLALGIKLVAIMLIVQSIVSVYTVVVRTHHKFSLFSKYIILTSFVELILITYLAIRYGFYGVLWGLILVALVGLIYFFKTSGYNFKLELHLPKEEVLRLYRIGFPLLLVSLLSMTLRNVDRFMIIALLGTTNLGYYSIATMMHSYVFQLPNLTYAVLFPRFYEAYGEKNDIAQLKDYLIKPTLVFAYLFPIVIGIVVLILPYLIYYVLPKYWAGLNPANLLLLGTFFLSIVNMSGYLLIALNKQSRIIFICTAAILVNIILNYLFIVRFKWGLEGVALGTAISYFIFSTTLIICAFGHYTRKAVEHLKFLGRLYLPFVWVVIVLYLLNLVFTTRYSMLSKDIYNLSAQIMIFLFATSPLVYYINKNTGILSKIVKIIKK